MVFSSGVCDGTLLELGIFRGGDDVGHGYRGSYGGSSLELHRLGSGCGGSLLKHHRSGGSYGGSLLKLCRSRCI